MDPVNQEECYFLRQLEGSTTGLPTAVVAQERVAAAVMTLTALFPQVLLPRGEGEEALRPDLALVDFANQMKLEYANIATIIGMCTDTDPYYIIYEYLDQVGCSTEHAQNQALPWCCCIAIATADRASLVLLVSLKCVINSGMW